MVGTLYSKLKMIKNVDHKKVWIEGTIRSYIRNFLESREFFDVSRNIMGTIPYGPAAGNYNRKIFSHISSGLYLKQCVAGGLARVYEIDRQYRNQKTDLILFKTLSFCQAGFVKDLTGSYTINSPTNGSDNILKIDFTTPFRRIDIANLGIPRDLFSEEASRDLLDTCLECGIKCPPPQTTAALLDKLIGHFLVETCTNPIFIINHPEIMSPEAKPHGLQAGLAERFELFINKMKICSGQTELTDPILQRQRFACQRMSPHRQPGDDEVEEILCEALEYGLAPAAGGVLGIDPLVKLLTDLRE